MKTKTALRDRKKAKKPDLRSLFRKAESSFQGTYLVSYAEVFSAIGERSAELLTELQAMQRLLRRVADKEIISVERRRIRRRLNRVIDFCNSCDDHKAFDLDVLEQLHLRLETEFAAVRPSFNLLRSIYEYPEFAAKGN